MFDTLLYIYLYCVCRCGMCSANLIQSEINSLVWSFWLDLLEKIKHCISITSSDPKS